MNQGETLFSLGLYNSCSIISKTGYCLSHHTKITNIDIWKSKKKLSKIIKYTGKKFVCVQKQFIYVLKRGIIAVVVVVVVHRNAMQI